jgi:CrcB protein
MFYSIAAIGLGASCGAVLRWFLDTSFNSLFPNLPLGTLTANLLGAYFNGVAMALFASQPHLSPEWRLLIITGFLGGLTTFSTFSAQVTELLQQDKILWAGTTIAAHVAGSLVMTFLGLATVALLKKVA